MSSKILSMSKKELRLKLGISATTLHRWLNKYYYDKITPLGYRKDQRILPPKVINFLVSTMDID